MTEDEEKPSTPKKGGKARDWLIIAALVIAVAVLLYLGTMDEAERYKLIGF